MVIQVRVTGTFLLLISLILLNREVIAESLQEAPPIKGPHHHEIIVSVKDQKLLLVTDGKAEGLYPVSTSMFGMGDRFGSFATPIGKFIVREKIGMGLPLGAVLRSRTPTGEILKPNAPGRDPIVTRILWLEGAEPGNSHAFSRGIYIHGTPQEKTLGHPASYGCVRMRSTDVATLFDKVGRGEEVRIIPDHLPVHESYCLNTHSFVSAHSGTPESAGQQQTE